MSINSFIFINENYNNDIKISSNSNINILCYCSKNFNVDINLDIYNESTINLKVLIIANSNINFNVTSLLKSSNSNSNIDVFAITLNKASVKINIDSIVPLNNINSKVNQKIKGLLLSEKSNIYGNPKLKIDSNEIIATHSLSIGGINKEELFFLLTKGFSEFETKKIIINSYMNNVLECLNEIDYNNYVKMIDDLIQKG